MAAMTPDSFKCFVVHTRRILETRSNWINGIIRIHILKIDSKKAWGEAGKMFWITMPVRRCQPSHIVGQIRYNFWPLVRYLNESETTERCRKFDCELPLYVICCWHSNSNSAFFVYQVDAYPGYLSQVNVPPKFMPIYIIRRRYFFLTGVNNNCFSHFL